MTSKGRVLSENSSRGKEATPLRAGLARCLSRCTRGRQLAATNPLEESTYFDYDENGNQTTVVAPGAEVAYFAYDPLNRLAAVQADALGVNAVTYYAYDPAGNRTRISDAETHPTYFAYAPARPHAAGAMSNVKT